MLKNLTRRLRPINNKLEEKDIYSSIPDKFKPLFLSLHEYQRVRGEVKLYGH